MKILQPPGWARARGFSNGIAASGKLVFIAGQIGWTGDCKWQARDFAGQFRQALLNVITVLKEAQGRPEHIVRLTWYVLDMDEYMACRRELGAVYRAVLGDHFPAMALVQVGRLFEPEARLEIEATAVVP